MTNKKKWIIGSLALLAVAALSVVLFGGRPASRPDYGVNILKNGSFEAVSDEGMPESWLPDGYRMIPGVSEFSSVPGRQGKGIQVRNNQQNDARFAQTVSVLPNTVYRLSGWVKANVLDGRGASLSIADVYVVNQSLLNTQGEWQRIEVYGQTASDQRELTVYARLGGYSADSQGEAQFDDLSLMPIESAPADATVDSWQTWKPTAAAEETDDTTDGPQPAWPWLLAIALGYALLSVWMARRAVTDDQPDLRDAGAQRWEWELLALLLAAALTRILLAALVPGYGVDIQCFTAWADRMAAVGPAEFYLTEAHSDYPPGYMLVLWPLGLIGRLLGTGCTGMMTKLPAFLCDLAAIVLLYRFAKRRHSPRSAMWLSALYALHPLVYVTGAAWGQVDSVPALLLLIVILLVFESRWISALPVYVLAVLMKPQALMFGPLGLVALIVDLTAHKRPGKLRGALYGMGISLVLAAAVVVPFSLKQPDWSWLIRLYGGTMSFYNYATVNATNLYFLFGLNWQPVSAQAGWLLRLSGALALLVPVGWFAVTRRQALAALKSWQLVLLAVSLLPAVAVAAVPMPISMMGTLLMIASFLLVMLAYLHARDIHQLPLLGAVLLILFCSLGSMMHERYPFQALILLTLAYLLKRDRRILALLIISSLVTFLNVGIVLDRAIRIGGVPGHLEAPLFGIESDSAWLEYALSALQVLVAALALYVGLVLSRAQEPATDVKALPAASAREETTGNRGLGQALQRLLHPRPTPKLDGRDWAIMLGATALYAVLALTNLGSAKAPQQPWISTADNNEVLVDLGAQRHFEVLYYNGIHWQDSDFDVSVSTDSEDWDTFPAEATAGTCFSWRYLRNRTWSDSRNAWEYNGANHALEGRYLRVNASLLGTTVMEMILRDADTGETITPVIISAGDEALFDEQDTLNGDPSWYNSAYFDEIYHARTAYEHLNALRGQMPNTTYETSHPPLGKLLMSLSVAVFGMTPFGWRFAGAMAGVLMLPAMYLIARLFTRKRGYALAALMLMAADCMHFAQTRIATIDSFVTLFIIWAFYYMFRFALADDFARPFRHSLPNLAASGLFMGLSIASKWTGMYAGVGLAAIFFWVMWRRLREGQAAERALEEAPQLIPSGRLTSVQAASTQAVPRAIWTMLWCLLFFIAVPLMIYYISFYPWFVRTPGGLTIKKVWDASVSMYNYHSSPGLGMDHFFYSPWYQWPLSLKPMWFYQGRVHNGTGSTIVTFGNLAVWWGGLAGLLCMVMQWVKRPSLKLTTDSAQPSASAGTHTRDMVPALLVIAFLAQYLPWIPVPRGTYIYHYFPSVPFIILSAVYALHLLEARRAKLARRLLWCFIGVAIILFVAFFPYVSGVRVSTRWLDAMKWFPNWLYY
ncbi:MAG: phospholipid carrier-dependent glycosyltransferase [Clostridiales bacterium]|nr:phospholipid carrier-dependent glycosyltransferase [Clostridiales bacterium]